jgi:hypothetical protein
MESKNFAYVRKTVVLPDHKMLYQPFYEIEETTLSLDITGDTRTTYPTGPL